MREEKDRVNSLEYLAKLLKNKDKKGLVGPLANESVENILAGLQQIVGNKKAKFSERKNTLKTFRSQIFL